MQKTKQKQKQTMPALENILPKFLQNKVLLNKIYFRILFFNTGNVRRVLLLYTIKI